MFWLTLLQWNPAVIQADRYLAFLCFRFRINVISRWKKVGLHHILWDAWVAGGVMDVPGEGLLHRHKLPVKYIQPIQNATCNFFFLEATICFPGAFSVMAWIYPVGTSAATFESFMRLILWENLHPTPSLNLLLLSNQSECKIYFCPVTSLRLFWRRCQGEWWSENWCLFFQILSALGFQYGPRKRWLLKWKHHLDSDGTSFRGTFLYRWVKCTRIEQPDSVFFLFLFFFKAVVSL